jgi:hypothetical protein
MFLNIFCVLGQKKYNFFQKQKNMQKTFRRPEKIKKNLFSDAKKYAKKKHSIAAEKSKKQ